MFWIPVILFGALVYFYFINFTWFSCKQPITRFKNSLQHCCLTWESVNLRVFFMTTNILLWFLPSYLVHSVYPFSIGHVQKKYENTHAQTRTDAHKLLRTLIKQIHKPGQEKIMKPEKPVSSSRTPCFSPQFFLWLLLFICFPRDAFPNFGNYLCIDSHSLVFSFTSFFPYWCNYTF